MHERRPAAPGGMLLLVVACCATLAGGCARQAGGSQPSGASRAAGQPHTTTVTLRDAGRTVTLGVGDRLDVTFAESGAQVRTGTGRRSWSVGATSHRDAQPGGAVNLAPRFAVTPAVLPGPYHLRNRLG